MLRCWRGGRGEGGRPGIGGGFELRSVFLFKCPALGKSSGVKKVQIPHSRSTIVGQKNSRMIKSLLRSNPPPIPDLSPQWLNIDKCIILPS